MASRTEANGRDRLFHLLDLNELGLEEVADSDKPRVVREAADYLKNQTLREIATGNSPVQGEGRFRILDPNYAREQKGGVRTANLELEGDLKDSLISAPHKEHFIKYGHEGEQVPKADGHNQMSLKAKAWARSGNHPKRRYIPDSNQEFDSNIVTGIRRIIDQNKRREVVREEIEEVETEETLTIATLFDDGPTRPATTTTIGTQADLFSDDIISELLDEAFRRRGF